MRFHDGSIFLIVLCPLVAVLAAFFVILLEVCFYVVFGGDVLMRRWSQFSYLENHLSVSSLAGDSLAAGCPLCAN